MEKIKTLYYERFIQHVVDSYSAKLKAAYLRSLHETVYLKDIIERNNLKNKSKSF